MIPSLSAEAERELIEGAAQYAREGGTELGLAFISEYERVQNLRCTHPQLGVPWRKRRKFPLRRFPYSVIYYTRGEEVRVIALAHQHRKPNYWAGRK